MIKSIKRGSSLSLAVLLTLAAVTPAWSATSQLDQDMVVLNPGGGVALDGSDGIRIHFNAFEDPEGGSDQVYFTNENNWCCSGGGPVMAVGTTVFGEASAASDDDLPSFDTLAISGITGANQRVPAGTVEDTVTYSATTGNAGATLTYTKVVGGKTYTLQRVVTYTYPNNYYDETWTVTIPAGNTEVVKLYVGGDTAPGGSDVGTGQLRTVNGLKLIYSANPDSGQYIGYSELNQASAWTRYWSANYSDPYAVIQAAGDIPNTIEEAEHDAGLQVQWTFGATPGTYAKSMRTTIGYNSDIPALDIRPLGLDLALDATVGGVVPGGQVLLEGGGLIANSPLELVMRSTPVVIDLNGQTADAAGNFSFRATLPAEIAAGVHSLTLTGTKPDGTPISDLLYFEIDSSGKLLWSQADTPRAALAATGPDSTTTMGLLLAALALVGFGVARSAARRTKKA